jgi:hypothetical protein
VRQRQEVQELLHEEVNERSLTGDRKKRPDFTRLGRERLNQVAAKAKFFVSSDIYYAGKDDRHTSPKRQRGDGRVGRVCRSLACAAGLCVGSFFRTNAAPLSALFSPGRKKLVVLLSPWRYSQSGSWCG